MQIQLTADNSILSLQDFFALHPTVSFPSPITNEALQGFNAQIHVPPPDIPALKAAAIAEIDRQAQVLYTSVIANAAIKDEYTAAYQAAQTWLANMALPVPVRVAALATRFGITHTQAAQLVVNKTTEANEKLEQRGAARLTAKTAIEAATTEAGIAQALQDGIAAMAAINFSV